MGNNSVSINPKKLKKVCFWPVPTNIMELHQFIGFALFMGSHIDGFSEIATPLFDLYKLDNKPRDFADAWNKNPTYLSAFTTLQEALVTSPVLTLIDHKRPVIISADMSKFATGHILAHPIDPANDDNISHTTKYCPILFGSHKLSQAERNMCATERELLGLVFGLCKN